MAGPSRGAPGAGARPRRFYQAASAAADEGGFVVLLDARTVRTPGGARLVLPRHALATLVAAEWSAQKGVIDFSRMAATRLAFTAAERIGAARAGVAADLARQAGADLLCYFAEAPAQLVQRQNERWLPLLDWAAGALGLRFERTSGIQHRAQPEATLARVEALALALDDFNLAGLALAASLFGSVVLAFALQRAELGAEEAFSLSRLDEAFQEEQWGVDPEAAERTARLVEEAIMLERWFRALD